MKKIIAFVLLPMLLFGCASTFKVGWDHSNPNVIARYDFFATTNLTVPLDQWPVFTNTSPPNLTLQITNLTIGKWYIYARAVSTNGISSDPSNVLIADIPDAPKNIKIIIVP